MVRGDIAAAVTDTQIVIATYGGAPKLIPVNGSLDKYVMIHSGGSSRPTVSTVTISAAGAISTVIDTLEVTTDNATNPNICYMNGNYYAVVYALNNQTALKLLTIEIDTGGNITNTVIDGPDTIVADVSNGYPVVPIRITSTILAVFHTLSTGNVRVRTHNISTLGQITATGIDSLELDANAIGMGSACHVYGDYYACAYTGQDSDGWLATVQIDSLGAIPATVTDTLEFDTTYAMNPCIIPARNNYYLIVYRDTDGDGKACTVSISQTGVMPAAVTDTLEFDTANCTRPWAVKVDSGVYAVAYDGTDNDGFLVTFLIEDNGEIGAAVVDSFEFDAGKGQNCYILLVEDSSGEVAIAYNGVNDDGTIVTVTITIVAGELKGNLAVVGQRLHYYGSDGVEYSIQGVAV